MNSLTITHNATNFTFPELNTNITYTYIINGIKNKISKKENQKNALTNVSDTIKTNLNRITTYYRNEILIVKVSDIAHIYIESSTTYIVDFRGRKSISNKTLECLFSMLDASLFFKVNRQHIVAISAIKRIVKCGSSLKLDINSIYQDPIYVGKNKVSLFKEWLNK